MGHGPSRSRCYAHGLGGRGRPVDTGANGSPPGA
jgi:hypothetical protein